MNPTTKKTTVSPAMQEVLDQYGEFHAPPLETLSPENARNLPTMTDAVQAVIGKHIAKRAFPFPEPVAEVEHRSIPGDSGELLVRIYRPESRRVGDNGEAASELPVLLYFHGGGWVIANLDTYDSSCRPQRNPHN
jgi:acetyl esterase